MRDLDTRQLSEGEARIAWVALFTTLLGLMAWLQTVERRVPWRRAGLAPAGLLRRRRRARRDFFSQARQLLRQLRAQKNPAARALEPADFERRVRDEIDRLVGRGVYRGAKEQL